MVLATISQRTYPSVKDIDDCAVVATVWAAASSKPTIVYPTCTTFRMYAGNPDDPDDPDGLTIEQVERGANGCWPDLQSTMLKTSSWSEVMTRINSGMPASVALHSAYLPTRLRFNFYGTHQVGIHRPSPTGPIYFANPLAPNASAPLPITEAELKRAMFNLIPGGKTSWPYRAEFFPKPRSGVAWGWDVPADIRAAYKATDVAAELRSVRITTYGSRVNLVDVEAGLKAKRISYGTTVNLVDVRAFMTR